MRITWFGQSAFLLEGRGADGPLRVITDPYTPELLGYAPIEAPADLVIRSSKDDQAHCRADLIRGEPTVVEALDIALGRAGPPPALRVEAVSAMEWEEHPDHAPGQNAMYRFELDGLRVAHMGDIGNPLSPAQIGFLRGADVLLALAGGYLTVTLDELDRVIREAAPRLVIPMHFRTLTYRPRSTHWIESFLAYHDEAKVDFAFAPTAEIGRDDLPDETRVLVLDYLR
jgi:L-ascorbate metabolism protein UlaG (beta-lactamase superfamily)